MKVTTLVALLFIGAVVFYVTGGGALFGVMGGSREEMKRPPNATFLGKEKDNPFFDEQGEPSAPT